ncbi:MAG TPA: hypothetical protein VG943_07685 [Caulobacterales bacterium]|nr:hypothetical protein [Caulobacterales bacterium]
MVRLILVLLVIAAVAGYFTRPTEDAMRSAANEVLGNPQNVSQGLQGLGATLAGDRHYDNYYVAAKYTVSLDDKPVVECWGAFTQVKCNRTEQHADAKAAS